MTVFKFLKLPYPSTYLLKARYVYSYSDHTLHVNNLLSINLVNSESFVLMYMLRWVRRMFLVHCTSDMVTVLAAGLL